MDRSIVTSARRAWSGLHTPPGRVALRRGVLPSLEHQGLLRWLDPAVVVDVGANRGQFSLDVHVAVPGAEVVAFEPLRSEADTYDAIFGSSVLHTLHRVALGETTERAVIHVSAARDSSSLLPLTRLQGAIFPGTAEVGTQEVEVGTLNEYMGEIRQRAGGTDQILLKLDIQGAELSALRGAHDDDLSCFRWIYLEASFVELYEGQPLADEVVTFLQARNFRFAGSGTPTIRDGRPVQVDLLFERLRPHGTDVAHPL